MPELELTVLRFAALSKLCLESTFFARRASRLIDLTFVRNQIVCPENFKFRIETSNLKTPADAHAQISEWNGVVPGSRNIQTEF